MPPVRGEIPSRVSFRQGLLSNLANPKIAVFFTSFLPQFVPGGQAAFFSLLTLGLVFSVMTLLWLTVYSVLVARGRRAAPVAGTARAGGVDGHRPPRVRAEDRDRAPVMSG